MKNKLLLLYCLFSQAILLAQNVGVGTPAPLGKLHIANGASGNTNPFGPLVVESNNNTYLNLLSPNANETSVLFGNSSDAARGGIVYNNFNTLDGLQFRTNGNSTKMLIDKFGRVGIGTGVNPLSDMLEVNGSMSATGQIRMNSLVIVSGGAITDFLIKNDVSGQVGFRKGYAGLSISYIIALQGNFPSQNPPFSNGTYIGEIKLFSGNNLPYGWAYCNGQLLTIVGNENLFAVIGTIYGGNGTTHFGLPDLRDAVPVGTGINWQIGERSN